MKKEQQILVIVTIVVVFYLYAFLNFILVPLNIKISQVKKLINDKTTSLEQARLLTESLPKLKQETKLLELEIVELEKKLPKQTNLPSLIKIISRQAQNYGIKLNTLTPQLIDSSSPQFKEIPFTISFMGSYHSVGQFLSELAQGERIIASRDLTLTYSGQKDYPINGTCIIYAFSLK